jgi:hypothetical protein
MIHLVSPGAFDDRRGGNIAAVRAGIVGMEFLFTTGTAALPVGVGRAGRTEVSTRASWFSVETGVAESFATSSGALTPTSVVAEFCASNGEVINAAVTIHEMTHDGFPMRSFISDLLFPAEIASDVPFWKLLRRGVRED